MQDSADRLLSAWRRSPNPNFDFELTSDIERILNGLSAEEIAAVYQLLASETWALRHEILMAWAVKDGPAALASLKDTPVDKYVAIGVFRNWMLEKPKEALAWLREGDVPPALSDQKETLLVNSLRSFVKSDPEFAFGELARMSRKEAVSNLRFWVDVYASDEVLSRRAWDQLEALATPKELAAIRKRAVWSMAREDPAAAADHVAALDLSHEERSDLEAQISMTLAELRPGVALDEWVTNHPDAARVPEAVRETLGTWLFRKPDEATRWLTDLPAGAPRDEIYGQAARQLASSPDTRTQAAGWALEIEGPELRSSTLRTLDRIWWDADPQAATRWRGTLAEDDLRALDPR